MLLDQVLEQLEPLKGAQVVDATFGAGGYSRALLERGANVVAIDRDPEAVKHGQALLQAYPGRFELHHAKFSQLNDLIKIPPDAIIFDIGVSSMQIDEAARGFSFQKDGPLDMRMAMEGPTAADIVNQFKEADLARLFFLLGEEKYSRRIAKMIVHQRGERPFTTTRELASKIEGLLGRSPHHPIHPATRVFQALRIHVNDELGELIAALFAAEALLPSNGKLGVVTFHSLEDRIVKRFFTARSKTNNASRYLPSKAVQDQSFVLPFKRAITATNEELEQNPRSRSAKLRVGIRTSAPAFPPDPKLFGLPQLVNVQGIRQ